VTEVRKESLSALLDGEASEIEVHRLVREYRSDESLSTSWASYQQIRTTLSQSSQTGPEIRLDIEFHQTLFSRISDAVEEEASHTGTDSFAPQRISGRRRAAAFGGMAVAASLVIAVFVGVQQNSESDGLPLAALPTEASNGAAAPRDGFTADGFSNDTFSLTGNAAPIAVQTVANLADSDVMPELVELDEEKQRRLMDYLNQHDQMSRMNVKQKFVNYPEAAQ
jgi:sigma-E factor negative regulatory protein RseA